MIQTQPYTLFSNKDLLRLIIPILLEQLLYMSVGAIDSMMIASQGDAAISSITLIDQLNNFVGKIFLAFATGGAVVASQYIGARKMEQARDSAIQLLGVLLSVTLAVCLVIEVFNESLLRLLFGHLEPKIHQGAYIYLLITAFSYPFTGIMFASSALQRSMNRSQYPLYGSILANLLNFIGNYLLIFVFPLGVKGAAISTLVARALGSLLTFYFLTNPANPIYVSFRHSFRPAWNLVRKILYIGIPNGIENGVFQFGRLITLSVIAPFGSAHLAANSVAGHISSFVVLPGAAFALAIVTVAGQAVGTGDEKQVRFYIGKMMKLSYLSQALTGGLVFLCLPLLLRCFPKLSPEAIGMARSILLLYIPYSIVLWPFSFVFPGALRAANDVRFPMTASILSMIFVRIGMCIVLARVWNIGVEGVWLAMFADWIVRCSAWLYRWQSNAWKKW